MNVNIWAAIYDPTPSTPAAAGSGSIITRQPPTASSSSSLSASSTASSLTQIDEDLYTRTLALVDEESQVKIKRYYHRADACRSLVGRLLIQLMILRERGLTSRDGLRIARTESGKPYIIEPKVSEANPPLAFNITHDNSLIALGYATGHACGPNICTGIDVMKVRLPGRETFRSFMRVFEDQLTPLERRSIQPTSSTSEHTLLTNFYKLWTLKEAYTKALGIGLGFNFSRVEYDIENEKVRVDGKLLGNAWRFWRFDLRVPTVDPSSFVSGRDGEGDLYMGMVACFSGDEGVPLPPELDGAEGKREDGDVKSLDPAWLERWDAKVFLELALKELDAGVDGT